MKIAEPTTMLTDYGLAVLLLCWAALLLRLNRRNPQHSRSLWAVGFQATALASLFGGTVHGFKATLGEVAAVPLWKGSVFTIGIASSLMLSAIIFACARRPWRPWLLGAVASKFLFYAVWMTNHSDFRYVVYDYASSMTAILAAQIHAWRVQHIKNARWIIGGIVVSFVAALIQRSHYSIHVHFNHNDLFHVVQMVAFYLFYRGGQGLIDRSADHSPWSAVQKPLATGKRR
jgi:hypothetical protein